MLPSLAVRVTALKKTTSVIVGSLSLGLILTTPTLAQEKPAVPVLSQAEFQRCLQSLASSNQFRRITNDTFWHYSPDKPDPTVIPLLNYQPEFTKPVWDYLSVLVDRERVADGIAARQRWATVLLAIEQHYGVKAEDVVAVWGVESDFGTKLGTRRLVDSLSTLSCFGRRQNYFRGEYADTLRIIQEGHVNPHKLTGSWAGAFGQTQFMPSTFLRLAQDFNGDGRKDIIDTVPDALASTANFLSDAGYRMGMTWGYEVRLPKGYSGVSGRKSKRDPSFWRGKGLKLVSGDTVPDSLGKAGLLLPAGENGPAFLVNKNFDTFYSYNASENYALAIAQLSEKIQQRDTQHVGFVTPWPTDDPGLSRAQSKEVQQLLLQRGYNVGKADGLIGSSTREAIKSEQARLGLAVDGRAGHNFYHVLKSGGR